MIVITLLLFQYLLCHAIFKYKNTIDLVGVVSVSNFMPFFNFFPPIICVSSLSPWNLGTHIGSPSELVSTQFLHAPSHTSHFSMTCFCLATPPFPQVHLFYEEKEKLDKKKRHYLIKCSLQLSLGDFRRTSLKVHKHAKKPNQPSSSTVGSSHPEAALMYQISN